PMTAEVAFEAFEPHVPAWERAKEPGTWRETWRERTADLLSWLVLLGLALPAAAHSPPNGPQRASSLDAWRACLDGARPDSENVPPVSGPPESRSDLPGSGTSPMDLDASHDHVVVDFRLDLVHRRLDAR
ncbi:MAG: hypothetical protein ABEL76_01375, partial [Bradymonadaceae bacterium]